MSKQFQANDIAAVVDFFFEVGILAQTPRSGFHFLGSGKQSLAEHINRVVFIGYALAQMDGTVDTAQVMKMCLLHDLSESRISDLNYVHQQYTVRKEEEAITDITEPLPFGPDLKQTVEEYEQRTSPESLLAKDADNLEWILSLKEQLDTGNSRAGTWIPSAVKRLKTPVAQQLAEKIIKTNSDHWWFDNPEDEWWVSRTTDGTNDA